MQEEAQKIELELPEGEVDIREADVDDSIPTKTAEPEVIESTQAQYSGLSNPLVFHLQFHSTSSIC